MPFSAFASRSLQAAQRAECESSRLSFPLCFFRSRLSFLLVLGGFGRRRSRVFFRPRFDLVQIGGDRLELSSCFTWKIMWFSLLGCRVLQWIMSMRLSPLPFSGSVFCSSSLPLFWLSHGLFLPMPQDSEQYLHYIFVCCFEYQMQLLANSWNQCYLYHPMQYKACITYRMGFENPCNTLRIHGLCIICVSLLLCDGGGLYGMIWEIRYIHKFKYLRIFFLSPSSTSVKHVIRFMEKEALLVLQKKVIICVIKFRVEGSRRQRRSSAHV